MKLRSMWPLSAAALGGLFAWLQPVPSIPAGHHGLCRTEAMAGVEYIVCDVPLDRYDVSLMALDASGKPFGTFQAAVSRVQAKGRGEVHLAMNAGMYHEDRRPVGLAVQDGRTLKEAVEGTGSGNFSLKPNGVFFIEKGRAFVRETGRYLREGHRPSMATQSGPMLLIDGELHPRFIEGSDSRFIRNGVCASDEGRVIHLVLSRDNVNFWDFATFFRDRLGCENALFFDGQVSSLYYPALNIDYRRDRLGPMLVVTGRS